MKKIDKEKTITATAAIVALIILAIAMVSCRMYERDYLREVPIPEIKIDSIDTGQWEDPIPQK